MAAAEEQPEGDCRIALFSSSAAAGSDVGLVRCTLRGQLPKGKPRCKVLAVVLDRSGSMAGAMWNRVVDGVVSVVNDDLLNSPDVLISLLVYADVAREVPLPSRSSELRDLLLSREFAPKGGTSFKAAFELAQRVLKRELGVCKGRGFRPSDVDLATLVFTDGEDTSIKMRAGAVPDEEEEEADAGAEQEANEALMQFQAFTGADERTAEFYIESSLRHGMGLEEAVSHFFERGGHPPPATWRSDGRARLGLLRAAPRGAAARDRPTLVDKAASLAAARDAGNSFRSALRKTGCASFVCVTAFGADHNPEQCQYLSDRYYYINRGEVLAEVLAGSLGALLSSAGQCALRMRLASGVTLEEPLPESLPLDATGRLDHHVWLRIPGECQLGDQIAVEVDVAGATALQGAVDVGAVVASDSDSFEDRLFLIDHTALQLRRVARELCGRRPAPDELVALRARLTDAKDRLQPTRDAVSVAVGQLRGRTALRRRLAEVEAARERLSYALGQFDESDRNDARQIGTVAIDAILRDAGQHVPQGPETAEAARRVLALASLPTPEPLSEHGKEYTTDGYSCCDAWELASQGDALFFQLGGVRLAPDGAFLSADSGCGFISHEAWVLLSRSGKQAVKGASSETGFTHLGLPLFATPGHFLRAKILLPEVLRRLTVDGTYTEGVSERQLLGLLGRALAAGGKSEAHLVALLHQARAVHAVLAATSAPPGASGPAASSAPTSLLHLVLAEASRFLEEPSTRADCTDLHAVAAAGLLQESWCEATLQRFGTAVVTEALRRRVVAGLAGAGEAQRLCLAWGLLGPADGSRAWLEQVLPCPSAGELCLDDWGFNPFTAPDELEVLEEVSPGCAAPRATGAAALLCILSSKKADAGPTPATWSMLRQQLAAWGRATNQALGKSTGSIWPVLDAHMVEEDTAHQKVVQDFVAALRVTSAQARPCLEDAFDDAEATLVEVATSACLPGVDSKLCPRRAVAAALRDVVERRAAAARAHPILGADFPQLEEHSAEAVDTIWGKPASPVDPVLHRKAYLRVWRRTMKARITMTMKEALADKEYRKRGGKFKFPSPMDTFIRGLHRRTADLHADWLGRLGKETSGEAARDEAVAEMLLRLRWDDSDSVARAKLSVIVARIWDGLEGVDLSGEAPISSALWLDDGRTAAPGKEVASLGNAITGAVAAVAAVAAREDAEATGGPAGQPSQEEEDDVWEIVSEGNEDDAILGGEGKGRELDHDEDAGKGKGKGKDRDLLDYFAKGKGKGEGFGDQGKGKSLASKGKGKGKKGGFRTVVVGADAAREAMDEGLQTAFDGLPADLRGRMQAFAADPHGRKVKLPVNLRAKQRKAIHLWAEMQGLGHQSFGYRGKRRLHLMSEDHAAGGEHSDEDWHGEDED